MENITTYYNRYKDKITFEHIGDEVTMRGGTWLRWGYDDNNTITMVDPSGGPYISLNDNLNEFWPKGKYQDLFVQSIKILPSGEEDTYTTIVFKIKSNGNSSIN